MKRRLVTWILIAAVVAGSLLRAFDLLSPYENGHRGSCLALFALMAKNHLRYGLVTTGGVGVLNPDRVEPDDFNYYLHHPPGAILLATVAAYHGGTSPAGLRLVFLPLSIGIVFLVWRLARPLGRFAATAAGSIAALAPIGVYYGAFVNFEIPTLFFTLLSLHRFLRYMNRGRPGDRMFAVLAHAAAVFCDWIALGLPLALLVLLPFRRKRGADRAGRVRPVRVAIAMLACGVFTVCLVNVWYTLQTLRFGRASGGGDYYREVTPFAASFRWDDFWGRQSRFLGELFGWPLLLLAVVGLMLIVRCRRRGGLDRTSLAALTLAAIGVANQLILANNATGHDYYLLYLGPGVALLAALPFAAAGRAGSRAREGGTLLLVIVAALLTAKSVGVIEERRAFELAEAGKSIGKFTDAGAVVLLPDYFTLQVAVAADRYVHFAHDQDTLDQAKRLAVQYGMEGRPVVFLVAKEKEEDLSPGFAQYLREHADRSTRGPYVVFALGPLR